MGPKVACLPVLVAVAAALAATPVFGDPPAPPTALEAELGELHARLAVAAAVEAEREVLSVARGDTLLNLLTAAEVPHDEATDAISALRDVFDPRQLQIGHQVTVLFEPRRGGSRRFVGLEIAPDTVRSVSVARGEDDDFESARIEKAVLRSPAAAEGEIRTSLLEAGAAAKVPLPVMMALLSAYSHDVDFQRDLQPGDRFAVLYERLTTDDGLEAGTGDLLYASLTLSGREVAIYRFTDRQGSTDYYSPNGESIRRALLRTPVDGARITSGFGLRRHPILGYSKMHKGVDFGAPTGTPVYAAGRGTVEEAGVKGSYGKYIRIRHNSEIATAYAHLSRFGATLRRGGTVGQGDVIGYVGTTGRSTGPHLHYEVLKHGRQVDPRSINLPTGRKLEGPDLKAFRQAVAATDAVFQRARNGLLLVTAGGAESAIAPAKPTCTTAPGC